MSYQNLYTDNLQVNTINGAPLSGLEASIKCTVINGTASLIAPTLTELLDGDVGSNYGINGWSSNTLTVPEDGVYEFTLFLNLNTGSSETSVISFTINGGDAFAFSNPRIGCSTFNYIFYLQQNQTISVKANNDSVTDDLDIYEWVLTIKKIAGPITP